MVNKITKINVITLYTADYRKKYYLREISSLLEKSHQTIKPYLEELVKEGVLEKIKRRNIIEYGLNFRKKNIYDYIVIAEKERLAQRLKQDMILNVLFEKLSCFFQYDTFIIFGSSVENIQKSSDIDLLIIGSKYPRKIIENFEKVYNKKIHSIKKVSIEKISSALGTEVYKRHLIFNNTEHIVRFWGSEYAQDKMV